MSRYGTRRTVARYGRRRDAALPAELAEPPDDLAELPAWWRARLDFAEANGGWPDAWPVDDDLMMLARFEFDPATPPDVLDRVNAEMRALRDTRPHPCRTNGSIEMRLSRFTF